MIERGFPLTKGAYAILSYGCELQELGTEELMEIPKFLEDDPEDAETDTGEEEFDAEPDEDEDEEA